MFFSTATGTGIISTDFGHANRFYRFMKESIILEKSVSRRIIVRAIGFTQYPADYSRIIVSKIT